MVTWYEDYFDNWYLEFYENNPRFKESYIKKEVIFLRRVLNLPRNSKILDLCCGHGRHSVNLAKKGYEIIAVDLSKKALNILKKEAKKKNLNIKIIFSDMREISFKNEFDAVINMFTSFGYLENNGEHFKALLKIANSLKINGKFLLDLRNKDSYIKSVILCPRIWYESNKYFILAEKKIVKNKTKELVKLLVINKKNKKFHLVNYTTHIYSLAKIKKLLKGAGLKVIKIYGNTTKIEKFHPKKSIRMVILAKKIK